LTEPSLTLRELLDYDDYLVTRWMNYFERHAAALDISIGGKSGTVRQLVLHIFQAQQMLLGRLLGTEPAKKAFDSPTLPQLMQFHQETRSSLLAYIAAASEEELRKEQTFASVSVTKRKILAQLALHPVHHWAQIAMEVRQAGFPAEKPQDIIISDVMA